MKIQLTIIFNWGNICKRITEYELVHILERRMKKCLKESLKEIVPIPIITIIFKDEKNEKIINYIGYQILMENDGSTNYLIVRDTIFKILQIIEAFENYDVPQIFEQVTDEQIIKSD